MKSVQGFFSDNLPTITDSTVLYGLPKDMDDWECENWKSYYLKVKSKFGKQRAIEVINIDSERASAFSSIKNGCKYNCEFTSFFKREGLKTGNIFSNLFCATDSVVTTATDTISNVASDGGSVASNISKTAKIVTSPIFLITGLAGSLIYYNRKKIFKKSK